MTLRPEAIASDLAPTGTLRAAINLGNPVLAQGTLDAPSGVTVDIARELAARLGVPVELACFGAARASFEAMSAGRADLCFLAIEPAREAEVAFTAPYVIIEGVFVVPQESAIATVAEADRDGVRIGVKQGSAYDLFLSRTLRHASVVRGPDGPDGPDGAALFGEQGLEVLAGIRQPMTEFVQRHPGYRLVDGRFMEIRQAVGTTRTRRPETIEYLRAFVEDLKASGFIAEALRRANQAGVAVAPPAPPAPSASQPAEPARD
jgi:polar amino acid transport system substrate-binding protein